MTLPASGAISFNAINVELGVAGTTQASLGQTSYRNLAGVPSGQISMSNFYGKANQFAFTIASNQTNANLRTLAINAGWNQSSKVVATINSGVYVSANSTGTPGLTINGSFPGGVELVNNGFIIGMGGAGGNGGRIVPANVPGQPGSGGGLALSASVAITVTNNGTIGGGGGGGGGGSIGLYIDGCSGQQFRYGGGGGGGGRTGATNSSGGAAGTGENGNGFAGGAGTSSSGGTGGNGGGFGGTQYAGQGGNGGSWGAAGGGGLDYGYGAGGGGAAGGAVSGNGNITWAATGTRLGSIS